MHYAISKKKKKIGFRLHDVINTKEKTVLESIRDAFEGEGCKLNTVF